MKCEINLSQTFPMWEEYSASKSDLFCYLCAYYLGTLVKGAFFYKYDILVILVNCYSL